VDTADQAEKSIAATLVLGALSAEICAMRNLDEVPIPVVGHPFPMSDELGAILGMPAVHSVESGEPMWSQVVLSNVRLGERTGQWLRIALSEQDEQLSLDFAPLIDDANSNGEPARMAGFGQINVLVAPECTEEHSVVSGNALWIDEDNRRHEVSLPADQELGSNLVFAGDVPWLPVSGTISWEARIDKQRRSLVSEDATEIRINSEGEALWPVVIHGSDWSGTALTTIAP